jgi:phage terminase Nu1 subunit (DNA packaging protein)
MGITAAEVLRRIADDDQASARTLQIVREHGYRVDMPMVKYLLRRAAEGVEARLVVPEHKEER